MTTDCRRHRLDGLEPGNLLAFLALLGLLRALEEAAPAWLPKVAWSVDEPPVRPLLSLSAPVSVAMIAATAATGVTRLAQRHDFGARKDLRLSVDAATEQLRAAVRSGDSYTADLWAALVSDAAVRERNRVKEAEPTPLCLIFGQGHQHFLERLSVVPREASFSRGSGRNEQFISPTACLTEALFVPWARPDAMPSFRWDPHEDVRYALRAADPTTLSTKETTQHGANRLAAVGLTALTVVSGAPCRKGSAGNPRRRPGPRWRLHLHVAALAGSDQPRDTPCPARSSRAGQPHNPRRTRHRRPPAHPPREGSSGPRYASVVWSARDYARADDEVLDLAPPGGVEASHHVVEAHGHHDPPSSDLRRGFGPGLPGMARCASFGEHFGPVLGERSREDGL